MRWIAVIAILALIAAAIWFVRARREPSSTDRAIATDAKSVDAKPAPTTELVAPSSESSRSAAATTETAPAARESTLRIHLVDATTGADVPNAAVMLEPLDAVLEWTEFEPASAKQGGNRYRNSDAKGRVACRVKPNVALALTIAAANLSVAYQKKSVDALSAGETREFEAKLAIEHDHAFAGRIVAADDESPIANAEISFADAVDRGVCAPIPAAIVRSNDDGRFEIRAVPPNTPACRIEAAGFGRALFACGRGHETKERELVVPLRRAARLNVHLIGGTAESRAKERLVLSSYRYALSSPPGAADSVGFGVEAWCEEVGSRDSIAFEDLPSDATLKLELFEGAKVVHRAKIEIQLAAGETKSIDFALDAISQVVGQVTDGDGKPVANFALGLMLQDFQLGKDPNQKPAELEANTDESGHYAFTNVAQGNWLVGPSPTHSNATTDGYACSSKPIVVPPDGSTVTVDFQVWSGLSIHGHVVDSKGLGVSGVDVVVENGAHGVNTKSGDDGEFRASPLEPGEYTARAGTLGGAPGAKPSWTQFALLRVKSGDQNVELVVHLGVELRCKLIDTARNPVASADCVLLRVTTPHSSFGASYTGASNGLVRYSNLAPGTYDLVAMTSTGSIGSTRVSIVEGTPSEATVVLERGAKFVATSRKDAGYVEFIVVAGDSLIGYGDVGKGASSTLIVPAGRLTIEYFPAGTDPTAGSTKSVTPAAGETTSVELDLGK